MDKPKKITIRFFLHKNVQPEAVILENGKETKAYPLYIYITYNRKNMQFRSNYSMFYKDMKDVENTDPGLMAFEEKLITKIIRYESSLMPQEEDYDMKGIKDKYTIYATSIITLLEKYLKPKVRQTVFKTNNELMHVMNFETGNSYNTVFRLYEAAGRLFDNFFDKLDKQLKENIETYKKFYQVLSGTGRYNFPTLIDWMDGSFKKELKAISEKLFKGKHELQNTMIKLIDKAVEKSIYELEKTGLKYKLPEKKKAK
jgi:hypothetical protein